MLLEYPTLGALGSLHSTRANPWHLLALTSEGPLSAPVEAQSGAIFEKRANVGSSLKPKTSSSNSASRNQCDLDSC